MHNEISTYGVAVLDHLKNSQRINSGYGKFSSLEEIKLAFGIKKQPEELEKLNSAIAELIEKKLILDIQRGKAFSITPLGNIYKPSATPSKKSSPDYSLNGMEKEILTVFYKKTNQGHDRETVEGLLQDVRREHNDWTREQVGEAIKVLIYQKFLDKKDVKTKIPLGRRTVGSKQEYSSVTTHYVSLSGKALMLLSNRSKLSETTSASVHVAENPYTTRRKLEELFASAKLSIKIVDAYIGRKTLDYLLSAAAVPVKIITSGQKEQNFDQALIDFQAEFKPAIEIHQSSAFHGRLIILDDSKFYLIDHSIKDFGSKPSSIVEVDEPKVQAVYKQLFDDNWN